MSVIYTCDLCGEPIAAENKVTLQVQADYRSDVGSGWVGHYHDEGCWQRISDGIYLVEEFGANIENIPTISGQAVAARRRRHRKQEGL